MRTEEPRPIRLTDYRPPPDWLIETVELDVSLDPTATRVRAKLKIKPNSASAPAPLVLDGDELKLISLALDGKPLPAESFVASLDKLTIAPTGPARPACNVLVATGSESRSDEAVGTKIITDASHAMHSCHQNRKESSTRGLLA
jgi:aminopeptidase N